MINSIFTRGRAREVYYRYGKFTGTNVSKFVHAPFNRVVLDGSEYCVTTNRSGNSVSLTILPWIATVDDGQGEENIPGHDFFYSELAPIPIEESDLGNYEKRGDDWTGLFRLGLI